LTSRNASTALSKWSSARRRINRPRPKTTAAAAAAFLPLPLHITYSVRIGYGLVSRCTLAANGGLLGASRYCDVVDSPAPPFSSPLARVPRLIRTDLSLSLSLSLSLLSSRARRPRRSPFSSARTHARTRTYMHNRSRRALSFRRSIPLARPRGVRSAEAPSAKGRARRVLFGVTRSSVTHSPCAADR